MTKKRAYFVATLLLSYFLLVASAYDPPKEEQVPKPNERAVKRGNALA